MFFSEFNLSIIVWLTQVSHCFVEIRFLIDLMFQVDFCNLLQLSLFYLGFLFCRFWSWRVTLIPFNVRVLNLLLSLCLFLYVVLFYLLKDVLSEILLYLFVMQFFIFHPSIILTVNSSLLLCNPLHLNYIILQLLYEPLQSIILNISQLSSISLDLTANYITQQRWNDLISVLVYFLLDNLWWYRRCCFTHHSLVELLHSWGSWFWSSSQ